VRFAGMKKSRGFRGNIMTPMFFRSASGWSPGRSHLQSCAFGWQQISKAGGTSGESPKSKLDC